MLLRQGFRLIQCCKQKPGKNLSHDMANVQQSSDIISLHEWLFLILKQTERRWLYLIIERHRDKMGSGHPFGAEIDDTTLKM